MFHCFVYQQGNQINYIIYFKYDISINLSKLNQRVLSFKDKEHVLIDFFLQFKKSYLLNIYQRSGSFKIEGTVELLILSANFLL